MMKVELLKVPRKARIPEYPDLLAAKPQAKVSRRIESALWSWYTSQRAHQPSAVGHGGNGLDVL